MTPQNSVRVLAVMVGLLGLPAMILFVVESLHSGSLKAQLLQTAIGGGIGYLCMASLLWTFQSWARVLVLCFSCAVLLFLPLLLTALLRSEERKDLGTVSSIYMMIVALLSLWVLTRPDVRTLFMKSGGTTSAGLQDSESK